jgi:hypothetical protein
MRSLKVVVCLLLFALVALPQSDRGTITGTVSDPAGAVVANAGVEIRNVETGAVYQAGASATGNYTLTQLPAGEYELSVNVPGFKKYVRRNITVEVAQTYRVDVALEVGSNTESITVEAAAPLLKTESGELSHTVTTNTMNNLPVMGIGAAAGASGLRNPYAETPFTLDALHHRPQPTKVWYTIAVPNLATSRQAFRDHWMKIISSRLPAPVR